MAYRKGYTPKRVKRRRPRFVGQYREFRFSGPPVSEYEDEVMEGIEREHGQYVDCQTKFHAYGWETTTHYRNEADFWGYEARELWKVIVEKIADTVLSEPMAIPVLPPDTHIPISPEDGESAAKAPWEEPAGVAAPRKNPNLEQDLFDFTRPRSRFPFPTLTFIDATEDLGILDNLRPFLDGNAGREFVAILVCFSQFWIRHPETWKGQGARSLVRHLFVEYEVPPVLISSCLRPDCLSIDNFGEFRTSKCLILLILLGQGGSLKRAAPLFGWTLGKKVPQFLAHAPVNWSFESALLLAEILAAGGSESEYSRISRHRFFQEDYSESHRERDREFLHQTTAWLTTNREELGEMECDLILSWAIHLYTEEIRYARNERPRNLWRGRSVARCLERAREYEEARTAPYRAAPASWEGQGWSCDLNFETTESDESESPWEFRELTSSEELREEGQFFQHCVGSYVDRCLENRSVIVSLRVRDLRTLTLEIDPQTRNLVQARGHRNRPATDEEMAVVQRWLQLVVREGTNRESN